MSAFRYPTPTADAHTDIAQYVPLLLAAIYEELENPDVWPDGDANTALGYIEDLKYYVMELPEMTAIALPVGAIIPFGGLAAPTGWLLCDGAAISRATYAGLFAVLGETYGVGDGENTFNLPDLRRRVPAGPGSDWTLGSNIGAESHILTMLEVPVGTFFMNFQPPAASSARYVQTSGANQGWITTSAGQAHNNVQPTLIVNFMIYAGA